MNKCRVALLSALLASTGAMAADDVDLNIGGFVWGEVGFGDRYDSSDDDQLGVSKAAVTVSPEYKNTRAVIVLGVDDMFNELSGSDGSGGDIEAKEAFVGIKSDVLGGTLDTTLGKQPLLFGLKPNGWVGDMHRINPGLEYGAGIPGFGGTAGQVQSAIILDWKVGGDNSGSAVSSIGSDGSWSIRVGMFDTDDGDIAGGTSLTDNWIIQVRGDDLFGTGIYGVAGYEQLDVAGSSEGIMTVGAGINFGMFDLSLEYQGIDENILGTADDETLIIAEATFNLNEQWSFYVDYATADELDVDTLRVGTTYALNEHLNLMLEYSDDSVDNAPALDTDSIDLRAAFHF